MEETLPIESCGYCNSEQTVGFKFCSSCGQRNSKVIVEEKQSDELHHKNLKSLATYAILSLVLLLINAFSDASFELMLFWTVCFAVIDLRFAYLQPVVWKLFKVHSLNIFRIFGVILIFIGTAFIVSYFSDQLNMILHGETYSTLPLFEELEHPLLIAILIIAVCPALFEELAFRGFVYNYLKVIGGEKSAIWGSSFLFALVHFSLISFVWLIPFALILSHYRKKYNTLIYGIIAHFTHNATTLLIEYYNIL